MEIPPGYRFKPSDEELISYYLAKKAAGASLPSDVIIEHDLYGSKSPWEIFNDNDPWTTDSCDATKKFIYVFTRLKSKTEGGSRRARTAGCGTWHGETGSRPILDKTGHKIGKWEMFVFVSHNEDMKNVKCPHWIMHEFSLARSRVDSSKGRSNSNFVVCKITRDDSKKLRVEPPSEDKKKKKTTLGKRKTPHEEKMTVEDSVVNNPAHSDLRSSFNQEANPLLENFDRITTEKEEEEHAFDADTMFTVEEILGMLDVDMDATGYWLAALRTLNGSIAVPPGSYVN